MNRLHQLTPLEILISNRQQLQVKCEKQKQLLNEDFTYIQENAGSLLLSGVSSLLFPPSKGKNANAETKQTKQTTGVPAVSLGLSDYFSVAQSLVPVAWDVVRPLLTAWGLKKVQTWAIKKLFSKKKQA